MSRMLNPRSYNCIALYIMLAPCFHDAAANGLEGAYVGANVGRARNDYHTDLIDAQLAGDAAGAGDTVSITDRSIATLSDVWSVDAGYFFNPYIGLEAEFLHLGQVRYIAVGTVASSGTSVSLASTTQVTSHGPALSVIFRLPIAEAFEADLRIGDYVGKTIFDNDTIVDGNGDFVAPTKSTSSLLGGVGAAYSVAGHCSFRVDYLRIQQTGNAGTGGKFNVNAVTAGISYTF